MTSWHRYLAIERREPRHRQGITGAANLAFLFIVISGMYLWLPRLWTWIQFKNVLWFRARLAPKARDFNWHNVIGVWTAIPLAIVVAGAVPISYPWASNLVYRIAGDTPPPPPAADPRRAPPSERPVDLRQRRCRCRVGRVAGADSGLAHHDDAPGDVGEGAGQSSRLTKAMPDSRSCAPRSRSTAPPAHSRKRRTSRVSAPAVSCVRGCASRTPEKFMG